MEDEHKIYWSALAKYFSGNASEDEKILVYEKRNQDETFEKAFQQAERLWRKPSAPANDYEPDLEGGWKRFQMKAKMREGSGQEVERELRTDNQRNFPWAIAASIALLFVLGMWFLLQGDKANYIEVQTAMDERTKIELPDGSMVTLNENSTLSYPEQFGVDNREVHLEGEAHFSVMKAEGKRFTVYAQNTKTEVIGTTFYLKAYAEKEVKIQVTSGKVAFASAETEEAVFLMPGQEAVVGNDVLIPSKKEITDVNFQAWETKMLVFDNTELGTLVKNLEEYFDATITIENSELSNCRFTASFLDPDLEEVLEIISITGNLTISREQGRFTISGNTCN